MLPGMNVQGQQSPRPSCRNTPGPRPRQLRAPRAIADAAGLATTTAVTELLQRSGAFAAHAAEGGQSVAHMLHNLHHVLQQGSSGMLHAAQGSHAHLHGALQSLPVADLHARLDSAADSLWAMEPSGAAHLPDAATMDAAATSQSTSAAAASAASVFADDGVVQPLLADVSASHTAAAAAVMMDAMPGVHQDLAVLASWATDKLALAQVLDPAAHASLRLSLGSVLGALSTAMDVDAGQQAQAWTNALVLGVQQLVVAVRQGDSDGSGALGLGSSSGGTVQAMVAAQEAMQATLSAAAGGGGGAARGFGSIGLAGLSQAVMMLVAMIVVSIPRSGKGTPRGADGTSSTADDPVPLRYDPEELTKYFSRRPIEVLQRNAAVVTKFSGLLVGLLSDWQTGQWDANMPQRAIEARKIMETLGPAYVKIAQVISTRVDIFPEGYLVEFRKLQDNVPTFSTEKARVVLETGLARPVDEVFEWLSEDPIAAASLGQVYRGKLVAAHGGAEVAVKVQRPGVLESVALDVFIMRRAAVLFSHLPGMSNQWAQVLDDWALRFFEEMDYQQEAHNTITFKKNMSSMQGVRVAGVFPDITSRKVIVTEWVDGERLNESSASDVRALCSTLLNCFLIQLLETGLLHADPHPGNLLRAPDGKIVLLDFGLVTEVSEEQRICLVEYIAHLSVEDWDAISRDLVGLGFVPPGLSDEAHAAIAPVMKQVMTVFLHGGGMPGATAGINMPMLLLQLEGCSVNYKLVIPPYFALILRAFSVIEGIALRADPDYNIVKECMPYLSRRLLTDNNPRMRAALKQLLYGDKKRLDVDRLQKMIRAFSNFSTAGIPSAASSSRHMPTSYDESGVPVLAAASDGSVFGGRAPSGTATTALARRGAGGGGGGMADGGGPVFNESMKEALKVVFAKDGSYAQELMVEELVAATDAMSREALAEGLRMVFSSAATVANLASFEALGPLRAMLTPLRMEMLSTHEPTLSLTTEDRQALSTIRALLDMLQPSLERLPDAGRSGSRALRAAGELIPMLPELLPGVQVTLEMFTRQLVRRMALRLAEDMEPGKLIGRKKGAAGKPWPQQA